MKKLILVLSLLSLTSCGGFKKMIGADYDNRLDKVDNKVDDLTRRVSALESKLTTNMIVLEGHTSELYSLQIQLNEANVAASEFEDKVGDNFNELADEITLINTKITTVNGQINLLSAQIDALVLDIAALQGYAITEIYDPCGQQGTYDEVILRTGNNELLAYFENGSNRYLAKLPVGTYRTTDGTHCFFSVTTGGVIGNEHN
jgi:archaellum component FlaC